MWQLCTSYGRRYYLCGLELREINILYYNISNQIKIQIVGLFIKPRNSIFAIFQERVKAETHIIIIYSKSEPLPLTNKAPTVELRDFTFVDRSYEVFESLIA
uniref:Uncharacterized protein n=1 Tax=Cacopsylla melanoneura TaxID=428564 RepID=A0A8D8R3H6_9HEMI